MPAKKLRLRFDKDALKEFRRLDKPIRETFKKKLEKLISGVEKPLPRNALLGFPSGYYKIKLRKAGVRLVYNYDGENLVILVIAVGKRDRSVVYDVARTRVVSKSRG